MVVGILTLRFYLTGCQSLKEKRRRVMGIRDKFGRKTNIAICESDLHDTLQNAQWSYIATAGNRKTVEQCLTQIEEFAKQSIDAVIISREIEYL